MYDANKYLIKPEVACYDFSYAELCTDYGPANIFISHVWSESAFKTLLAIQHLARFLREHGKDKISMPGDSHKLDSSPTMGTDTKEVRIWFCTTCNNQARVKEELGEDVNYSPFAQVLQSPQCSTMAVVSPLEALGRKWCIYEFCLGSKLNKRPLLVTSEGIFQAGTVAPKELYELAKKLPKFRCEHATCTSPDDANLIDSAVDGMGGYDKLDSDVKQIFFQAIEEAHAWTQEAFKKIEEWRCDALSSDKENSGIRLRLAASSSDDLFDCVA
eukprot:gnl/TRDRNA2_/TRDRNA2_59213_c0_seq1.p1 gnl/TRDRNA2_/TRDRNA2_59213_c0~~gnl/TRDRNA2_/TRDRNA2_59213_c0_seq1.p1  ORF type:complete len:298 (-),score=54.21 gnl/TRDRNA2_/TRDRNA2_59213_c0_seq1:163-978(-)